MTKKITRTDEILFEVTDILGRKIRTSKSYWQKIKEIAKTLLSDQVYSAFAGYTQSQIAKLIIKQSAGKQLLLDNAGNAFDVAKIIKLKRAVVKIETK